MNLTVTPNLNRNQTQKMNSNQSFGMAHEVLYESFNGVKDLEALRNVGRIVKKNKSKLDKATDGLQTLILGEVNKNGELEGVKVTSKIDTSKLSLWKLIKLNLKVAVDSRRTTRESETLKEGKVIPYLEFNSQTFLDAVEITTQNARK